MAALGGAQGPKADPPGKNAYDKEIVDMAEYIHSYTIDSDLAVSEKT